MVWRLKQNLKKIRNDATNKPKQGTNSYNLKYGNGIQIEEISHYGYTEIDVDQLPSQMDILYIDSFYIFPLKIIENIIIKELYLYTRIDLNEETFDMLDEIHNDGEDIFFCFTNNKINDCFK